MNQTSKDRTKRPYSSWQQKPDDTTPPATPVSWHPWVRLYRIAPFLRWLHETVMYQKRPPRPLSKSLMLSLAAAFADPDQREVLRALILDLLTDDIVELLADRNPEEF